MDAIVARVQAYLRTACFEGLFHKGKVFPTEVVLRIVILLAWGIFDKIDAFCSFYRLLLCDEPWEGEGRGVVYILL